jgi:hypothetical protein
MAERSTPKMPPSPPELVARFAAVLDGFPEASQRKMFGYPAAFVGGNMATSLFSDRWVVRLPPDEIEAALGDGAAAFEPMPGRPMTGFVTIPEAALADDDAVRRWVGRGVARAASMPPKTSPAGAT